MKVLFLTLFVTAMVTPVKMTWACEGEAQLIAPISAVKKVGYFSCLAAVDLSQVSFFSPSGVCPLDLSEINEKGIEVGIKDGHDCGLGVGELINGVVQKLPNGKLIVN